MKNFSSVYIMTNKFNTVLYIGVTNNLLRRVFEHKNALVDGFSKKYNLKKLVWFENFNTIEEAILVEKKDKRVEKVKKSCTD